MDPSPFEVWFGVLMEQQRRRQPVDAMERTRDARDQCQSRPLETIVKFVVVVGTNVGTREDC